MLHIHNRAPTYSAALLYYSTDYCTALQSSAVPPPSALLRLTKLPHVCLLNWLRDMRFDEGHRGLLQIEGGIAIAARLRCALQKNEVRRKFHVGRGGTAHVPRRIIIAVFDLLSIHLVDVSAFQRSRHHVCRIELHSLYDIRIVCSRLSVLPWPRPNTARV